MFVCLFVFYEGWHRNYLQTLSSYVFMLTGASTLLFALSVEF